MVLDTPRRSDNNLRPHFQSAELPVNRLPAVNRHDTKRGSFRQKVELLGDLNTQFAGRNHDQSLRVRFRRIGVGQKRERERRGFAGSGLRLPDKVMPGEKHRNRPRLNRGRCFPTRGFHRQA